MEKAKANGESVTLVTGGVPFSKGWISHFSSLPLCPLAMQDSSWSWERATASNSSDIQDQDILIFGYSAKLFRDDEKALEIDQGRHLVPWMGQSDCLIDRCVNHIEYT